MREILRALSVQQPWAWAIVNGHKPVENRGWSTGYRGELLIHAGKTFDLEGYGWLLRSGLLEHVPTRAELDLGGIVGQTRIIDCVDQMDSPWFFGPFGFVLDPSASRPLPFRPLRGHLGFFDVPQLVTR